MLDTPAIRLLSEMFPSIITHETQTGDGLNGYGRSITYWVKVVVLCEKCALCDELSLTENYTPNGCRAGDKHKWQPTKHLIIAIAGITLDDALRRANKATFDFLLLVAKRAPEFYPKFLARMLVCQ